MDDGLLGETGRRRERPESDAGRAASWLVGFCWFVSVGRALAELNQMDAVLSRLPPPPTPPGLVEINPLSLGVGRSLDWCWGRPLAEFMFVRSFPWFICGGAGLVPRVQVMARTLTPLPPPVQPFLHGGSKPPPPPIFNSMPFCWFAPPSPPERCGCDVSCPLEALFSACLVARATRGLMCAVCVRLCSRVRN